MQSLSNIWQVKNDSFVSKEKIQEVEKSFTIRFPKLLVDVYMNQNGGRLKKYLYRGNSDEYDSFMPDGLLEIENFRTFKSILDEDAKAYFNGNKKLDKQFPNRERLIVISRYGYDLFVCLDYNSLNDEKEPKVVVFDTMNRLKIIERYNSLNECLESLLSNE